MEQSESKLLERKLDLNEVLVFQRVVQCGSFTRAAHELRLPKSTVSRKVSELEARLGARLLQRTTRRLSLTDAGRTFHQYSTRIAGELEEALRAVQDLQGAPRGILRVTAPVSMGFLGRVVAKFLDKNPEVQIDLVCTDRVVNLIEEGFDVGIRAGKLQDSSLIARPLPTIGRYMVAAPKYLERQRPPRSPEDLTRHDCLLFGPVSPKNTWELEDGSRTVEAALRVRLLANDIEVLREAALSAQGIALLPSHACDEDLKKHRFERVLPKWSSPVSPLHAVYPSSRHLSPKVTAFVAHLQREMKGRAWDASS